MSRSCQAYHQHGRSGIATSAPYNGDPILRASEVGHYVFCRRAWWLARVRGCRPDDPSVLTEGIRFHSHLGHSVSATERWQKISYILIGLGLAVGIFTILGSCGAAAQ